MLSLTSPNLVSALSNRAYKLLSEPEFQALFNMLKMFVLLTVPEHRRIAVLGLLQCMVESHSGTPGDPLPHLNQAILDSIRELRDTGATLSAFERRVNDDP